MTSLLGILAYVATVAGFGAVYWWFERRTSEEKSPAAAPPPERSVVPPVAQPSDSSLQEPERTQEPETVPPLPEPPTPVEPAAEESSPVSSQEPERIQEPETVPPLPEPPTSVEPAAEDVWFVKPPVSPSVSPVISATSGEAERPTDNWLAIEQTISLWGKVGQVSQISALEKFSTHADSKIRAAVATALGKIAGKKRGIAMERMVPLLGKLSQDANQEVQLSAIAALGNIRSTTVLPWLQRALRSPNGRVNKSASLALQRVRLQYPSKPTKPARVPIQRHK